MPHLSPHERSWLNNMSDLPLAEQRAVTDSVEQLTHRTRTHLLALIATFAGFLLMLIAYTRDE